MFEKFTEGAIKVIMLSQEEARRMGHNFVGTEQLLLGVIGQRHGIGAKALRKLKVTLKKARKEIELYIGRGTGFIASEIPFTPRAKRVLEMAVHEGKDLGQNFVGTEHILLALIAESDGVAMRTLDKLNVDIPKLRNLILTYIEETQEEILRPLTQAEKFLLERERKGTPTPTLDEYAENITKSALDGKLDPVIGREKEIDDVIAILARRTKNNPVLIGEPGVGKTAVAEGLAQLVLTEKIPEFLDGSLVMALDLGSILAGTKYRGEFEERLKKVVEEAQNDPSVIIVIDEIHTLVGAGAAEGAVDAANILKPALSRGKFRCIGATTNEEYKKYIEKDPALERRFQPVHVEEPDVGTTIAILRGLRSKFEQHHSLSYQDKALEQAAILSDKYVADRYLPDKAIDVLDEAGSRVRLENRRLPLGLRSLMQELQETIRDKEDAVKEHDFEAAKQLLDHEMEVRTHIRIMKQSALTNELRGFTRKDIDMVTDEDVAGVISNWTGIPVTKITGSESARLLKMEETIHKRIIGQEHAVVAVSRAIRRARVGLRNPKRPIASFIFAGPTGVGKTELTKALSDYMFGNEDMMIRLDMSEYMEKHTVAKLIGSPPGYVGYNEGGQLTEAVRAKPYSVVLFDEVEKAHPDVFNLLLQILDDGRLTDSRGKLIDFTNTLIIMTTNLGSKIIEKESGIKPKKEKQYQSSPDAIYGWAPAPEAIKDPQLFSRVTELVNDELKKFFRPEFLNRIDEIVVFNHLTKMNIWDISGIMIKSVEERLKEKELNLVIDLSVRAYLADVGYDPIYGARPLRRAIMTQLEDKIAEECLSKTLYPNTKIIVTRKKVDGTLMNYTNELQITLDISEVDPRFFKKAKTKPNKSGLGLTRSLPKQEIELNNPLNKLNEKGLSTMLVETKFDREHTMMLKSKSFEEEMEEKRKAEREEEELQERLKLRAFARELEEQHKAELEAESESESRAESESESRAESESESRAESESESRAESGSESRAESESESRADSRAESGSKNNSGKSKKIMKKPVKPVLELNLVADHEDWGFARRTIERLRNRRKRREYQRALKLYEQQMKEYNEYLKQNEENEENEENDE